jgi:hypothetical protein
MERLPPNDRYKLDALQRTTDHVIGFDLETEGYVAVVLTAPMSPYLIEQKKITSLTLSALQSMIDRHVSKELNK